MSIVKPKTKTAPTTSQIIELKGVDHCEYHSASGTVTLKIITIALTRDEERMLDKVFPNSRDQIEKLLKRETIIEAIM